MAASDFFVERDCAAFRALVAKVMKLGALEIVDGWVDGDVQVFKLATSPDLDRFVPKKFQHFIPGGKLTYVDIIRYDPKNLSSPPYVLEVESIPPVFASKATITSKLTIEEVDETHCRQSLEGDIDIKIVGLGAIAERIIASNLKSVYSGIPQIVDKWVAFRNEVLQSPEGRDVLYRGKPDLTEDWISAQVQAVLQLPTELAEDSTTEADEEEQQALQPERTPPSGTTMAPALSAASRARSMAVVDGEIFYEPDELLADIDDKVTMAYIRRDYEMAKQWHERYAADTTQPVPAIDLTEPAPPRKSEQRPAAAGIPDANAQFDKDFNDNENLWSKYWDKMGVIPASVPNVKARLGHLFGLAAGWGLFKAAGDEPDGNLAPAGTAANGRTASKTHSQDEQRAPSSKKPSHGLFASCCGRATSVKDS